MINAISETVNVVNEITSAIINSIASPPPIQGVNSLTRRVETPPPQAYYIMPPMKYNYILHDISYFRILVPLHEGDVAERRQGEFFKLVGYG